VGRTVKQRVRILKNKWSIDSRLRSAVLLRNFLLSEKCVCVPKIHAINLQG
jgi:hypothetical protein